MALKPARLQWSDDGSLASLDYGDIYFQRGLGLEESRYVFLEQNSLSSRFRALRDDSFHIAELGFGSGLNFLLTAELFAKEAPASARLIYAAIEKHPVQREDLAKIYSHFSLPDAPALLVQYPPMTGGFHHLRFLHGRIRLILLFGDVAEMLQEMSGGFDAWYLDGFSPAKNPAMWDESLFPLIAARTRPGGTVSTFSAAGQVRRGLENAGFTVEKTKGYGVKRDMTVARKGGGRSAHGAKRVAVLGAGIAGCAAAHALKIRGHDVTLIDRSGIAQETSGNPAGILYPKMTVDPAPLGRFHSHAFLFSRQLVTELGLPSWRSCGAIHLDLDAEDAGRTIALLARNEFPPELAVAATYAGRSGLGQALAGMLSPPEFCAALARDIPAKFGAAVSDLRRTAQGWDIVGDNGAVLDSTDIVFVAQGFGSKNFPQTEWLPLQSLRGQVTYLEPTAESWKLDKVICHDGYITPVVGGLHYIGATFQKEDPGTFATRAEDDAANLEKLSRCLPQLGLSAAQVRGARAGYRATTPDKLPVIGPAPDYEAFRENFAPLRTGKITTTEEAPYIDGLYITTGFGAHGLSGAPLAGDIVAAMISGEPLPVPLSLMKHLLPERFIFRGLKRRKI